MLKSINDNHQQMLKLTNSKITLSDKLYDCIDEATEEMERDIGSISPTENESDNKGPKSKRNKKDNCNYHIIQNKKFQLPNLCTALAKVGPLGKWSNAIIRTAILNGFTWNALTKSSQILTNNGFAKTAGKIKSKLEEIDLNFSSNYFSNFLLIINYFHFLKSRGRRNSNGKDFLCD